jgi:hypothetical protein
MEASTPEDLLSMLEQDEIERCRLAEERRRTEKLSKRAREAEVQKTEAMMRQRIANAKAIRSQAIERGEIVGGERCPYCGLKYAWNGIDCRHCNFQDK